MESGEAPFKRLYVRERGRLARAFDPRFIYWFEYACKLNGIQVCYSVDKQHVDYSDAFDHSEVVASFVTSAVENVNTHNELRSIRARTRYGTRTHVTKAFFVGARAPYGTERWLVQKSHRGAARAGTGSGNHPPRGVRLPPSMVGREGPRRIKHIYRRLEAGRACVRSRAA